MIGNISAQCAATGVGEKAEVFSWRNVQHFITLFNFNLTKFNNQHHDH